MCLYMILLPTGIAGIGNTLPSGSCYENRTLEYLIYKYVTDDAKYDIIIPNAAKVPPNSVTVR